MNWLFDILNSKIKAKFTGSIRINFFNGGISNINVEESIKPPV